MSPTIRIRKNVKGKGNIKTSWDTGPVREFPDIGANRLPHGMMREIVSGSVQGPKLEEIKPRVKKLEYPRLKQILYKRALEGK